MTAPGGRDGDRLLEWPAAVPLSGRVTPEGGETTFIVSCGLCGVSGELVPELPELHAGKYITVGRIWSTLGNRSRETLGIQEIGYIGPNRRYCLYMYFDI